MYLETPILWDSHRNFISFSKASHIVLSWVLVTDRDHVTSFPEICVGASQTTYVLLSPCPKFQHHVNSKIVFLILCRRQEPFTYGHWRSCWLTSGRHFLWQPWVSRSAKNKNLQLYTLLILFIETWWFLTSSCKLRSAPAVGPGRSGAHWWMWGPLTAVAEASGWTYWDPLLKCLLELREIVWVAS